MIQYNQQTKKQPFKNKHEQNSTAPDGEKQTVQIVLFSSLMNKTLLATALVVPALIFAGCSSSISKEDRMQICGDAKTAIFSIGFSLGDTAKADKALKSKLEELGKDHGISWEEVADMCEINL